MCTSSSSGVRIDTQALPQPSELDAAHELGVVGVKGEYAREAVHRVRFRPSLGTADHPADCSSSRAAGFFAQRHSRAARRTHSPGGYANICSCPYVELHCHSAFSFLDGASLPDELVAAAVERGHTALALTDHDTV